MSKIYKAYGKYYKMVKPAGHNRTMGYHHYALWRPVVLVVIPIFRFKIRFYYPDMRKEDFLLDMDGFERVK